MKDTLLEAIDLHLSIVGQILQSIGQRPVGEQDMLKASLREFLTGPDGNRLKQLVYGIFDKEGNLRVVETTTQLQVFRGQERVFDWSKEDIAAGGAEAIAIILTAVLGTEVKSEQEV